MKKRLFFIPFLLILLLVFACNLEMPSAIRIIGSPEFRFSVSMDISEHMMELIGDMEDGANYVFIQCINTEIITYIMYYDKELETDELNFDSNPQWAALVGSGTTGYIVGTGGTGNMHLLDAPIFIEVKKPELGDDFPEGFSFKPIQAKLFIYGSEIVDILTFEVEVEMDGDPYFNDTYHGESSDSSLSSLKGSDVYRGTAIPAGGKMIDIPFAGDAFSVNVTDVYIEEGETVFIDWAENPEIHIELVIWLPFSFIAEKGAELELPGLFSEEDDLFGREEPGDENPIDGILESVTFTMNLNKTPFSSAFLKITSGENETDPRYIGFPPSPIIRNRMVFDINEKMMNEINNPLKIPFTPLFAISFPNGGELNVPKDFRINDVTFTAKMNYRVDF